MSFSQKQARRYLGISFLHSSTAILSALIIAHSGPVHAQDAAAEQAIDLGTILLRGTKRDETLEGFAGSVSVEAQEDLEDKGIDDGFDIVRETPGANQYSFGDRSNSYVSIRGVGPLLQPLSPDDSSVLTFVDGAPLMLEQSSAAYLDLEQVEVFKGPQNTLFGRSTSGGAVNLVPATPTDELGGHVTLEYGTDSIYKADIVGNMPIIPEVLSARIALRQTGKGAYVDNTAGPDFGAEDISAGRLSLLWTPSGQTSVLLTYFAEDVELTPSYYVGQAGDSPNLLPAAQNYSDDDQSSHVATMKIEHEFDRFRFTSQTSLNRIEMDNRYQGDHNFFSLLTGLPASNFANGDTNRIAYDKEQTRLTQEFRLSSLEGSPTSWVFGIVGYRDEYDIKNDSHVAVYQGAQSGFVTFDQTNKGAAIFADVSVPLSDRWTLSGGLRYTQETKEFRSTYDSTGLGVSYPGVLPTFSESGKETYGYWSGKLAASYELNDTTSIYASVARGYKSGGFGVFNSFAAYGVARDTYEPSKTLSYEIGGRTTLADGRLELSGAIFHIDMTDAQIMLFDPSSFGTENANLNAKSTGFEIDSDWYINDNWDLSTGVTYTKTRITSVPASAARLNPGLEQGDQLPNTPKWAANIALGYRADTSQFGWTGRNAPSELSFRLSYSYQSTRFFDAANNGKIDPTHLVSARLGLSWDRSELYVFGENLTNETYYVTRQPFGVVAGTQTPAYGVSTGRGRNFGVGYNMTF